MSSTDPEMAAKYSPEIRRHGGGDLPVNSNTSAALTYAPVPIPNEDRSALQHQHMEMLKNDGKFIYIKANKNILSFFNRIYKQS
jgi:hypothetical protein